MCRKNIFFKVLFLSLLIALFTLSGGMAVAAFCQSQRIIQTYGEAELRTQPDLAQISSAIRTRHISAENAVEENAMLANKLLEALLEYGLSKDDLKTSSYRLNTYRERQNNTEEEQIYYQVTNEIIIFTKQLDRIGEMIDLAVKAGANHINYINFELEDPQRQVMEALGMATRQAHQKAITIAESINENIIKIDNIREERTDYTPFRLQQNIMQRQMTAELGPTPITVGEIMVRATVVAEFSF